MSGSINVLIAALGGEGGGVLTNWIVAAANAQGLPVQATSIPGVAQRTGATTYYVEIWPQAVPDGKRPVLALSPAPGEVDIVATTELLETGRCIVNGFVTPERTHLIASIHRVYTTLEKMVVGDGRVDVETLMGAARERAKEVRFMDLDALAQSSNSRVNAVLFGVLAGSGKLPLSESACKDAIRDGAIAVEANLAGFDAGLKAVDQDAQKEADTDLTAVLTEAKTRLSGYQGEDYARLYYDRLRRFEGVDPDLGVEVAKGLARRMTYEDIIRVAQLKTRPGRQNLLSGGAVAGEVVHITEYFRPGLREICDILPTIIARRILAWANAKPKRLKLSWPIAVRSTTVSGFVMLKLLSKLRPLRRISYRYRIEQEAIDGWLSDIALAQDTDPALALEIARNAWLIKGYGDTHARGQAAYDALRDGLGQGASAESIAAMRTRALMDRPG